MTAHRVAFLVGITALAGCGGHARSATPPPQPKLPHALAVELAARADEISSKLRLGDTCGAQRAAAALQRAAIAAINAHNVPSALQEPLQSAATRVAAEVVCVPAQATPPPAKEHGHRHKEKKKHGEEGD